jgi:hypothetical protein
MGYVTKEIKSDDEHIRVASKAMSSFEDASVDFTPVVRSFLLQLLLQYK